MYWFGESRQETHNIIENPVLTATLFVSLLTALILAYVKDEHTIPMFICTILQTILLYSQVQVMDSQTKISKEINQIVFQENHLREWSKTVDKLIDLLYGSLLYDSLSSNMNSPTCPLYIDHIGIALNDLNEKTLLLLSVTREKPPIESSLSKLYKREGSYNFIDEIPSLAKNCIANPSKHNNLVLTKRIVKLSKMKAHILSRLYPS